MLYSSRYSILFLVFCSSALMIESYFIERINYKKERH